MNRFLSDLASKKPAPGGGSASAMAGAMAAALVRKVCLLTIGKKKYQAVSEHFSQLNQETERLQKELIQLVKEDEKAFLEVLETKGSEKAVKRAAEIPLETAKKSLAVLKIANDVSEKGNQNLRSDAFCAMELATASVYGALENVRANLPYLQNEKEKDNLKDQIDQILDGTECLVKP
jgi:formiminotetrahydrofolate cyclodeaminase